MFCCGISPHRSVRNVPSFHSHARCHTIPSTLNSPAPSRQPKQKQLNPEMRFCPQHGRPPGSQLPHMPSDYRKSRVFSLIASLRGKRGEKKNCNARICNLQCQATGQGWRKSGLIMCTKRTRSLTGTPLEWTIPTLHYQINSIRPNSCPSYKKFLCDSFLM